MLTSVWQSYTLPRDSGAAIRVPQAAMRARHTVRSSRAWGFGNTGVSRASRHLSIQSLVSSLIPRGRHLALAGTAVICALGVGFALRFPAAGFGPETPPLNDLEAAWSGPDPVLASLRAAPGESPAPATTQAVAKAEPYAPRIDPHPAAFAVLNGPVESLDPAGRVALAVETAPAATNRLVEVKRGDTLMNLLVGEGIDRGEAHVAITALTDVFSPRHLKVGQVLRLALLEEPGDDGEGSSAGAEETLRLVSLSLTSSPEEDVHVTRQAGDDQFVARVEARRLDQRLSRYQGVIDSSLFETARNQGMPVEAVVDLIHLFSFDVDFQREIRIGDSFEVLYDSYYDQSGALAKTGPLRYAAMVLRGKRLEFYRFIGEDGREDHFDAEGKSVRRALLRTPVDGARISSGYGMRKHPILGYSRMHRGVDFAAPRGTPIYAAGNGTIERLGRNGGYGKYIRIRHNGTYKTAYAHMRSYAKGLKRGARVKQGQVIGYVGSTGNSTGPHLHYEVLVNNKQVNPRKIKLPSGRALKGEELAAFQKEREEIDRLRQVETEELLMVSSDCGADSSVSLTLADGTPGQAGDKQGC